MSGLIFGGGDRRVIPYLGQRSFLVGDSKQLAPISAYFLAVLPERHNLVGQHGMRSLTRSSETSQAWHVCRSNTDALPRFASLVVA